MNLTTEYVRNGRGIKVEWKDIAIVDKTMKDCDVNCRFGDSCFGRLSGQLITTGSIYAFKMANDKVDGYEKELCLICKTQTFVHFYQKIEVRQTKLDRF